MTPELCASCVSRTAIVVCSSGQTTTSESCSHPENPSGFVNATECESAGRYRTLSDIGRTKEVGR